MAKEKVHVILDSELLARIKLLAEREERPLSRQITYLLRIALDGDRREAGADD